MRFVADESCDFAIVRALRSRGHDVSAVAEVFPRSSDTQVLNFALSEQRILITEDKDFGELVYAYGQKSHGVMLVRFPSQARGAMVVAVLDAIDSLGSKLESSFVVVQSGRIRVGN